MLRKSSGKELRQESFMQLKFQPGDKSKSLVINVCFSFIILNSILDVLCVCNHVVDDATVTYFFQFANLES